MPKPEMVLIITQTIEGDWPDNFEPAFDKACNAYEAERNRFRDRLAKRLNKLGIDLAIDEQQI